MKTLLDAIADMAVAFRKLAGTVGLPQPRTLYEVWERKMDPYLFERRGLERRQNRRKVRHVALLKMIGGILQVLFWFFVLAGMFFLIGLIAIFPVLGIFLFACAVAGALNAWYRYNKDKRSRMDREFDEWRQG